MKKILLFLIPTIAVITLCGVFGYKYLKESRSIGTTWGETYYEFLQNMSNAKNKKILFVESDFYSHPILVAYENVDDNDMLRFAISFYAIEKGKVKNISNQGYGGSREIKFMYDVKKDKYNYFLYHTFEENKYYESFDSIIIDFKVGNIVTEMVTKEHLSSEERNKREKEEISKYDNYSNYDILGDTNKVLSYVVDTDMNIKYFDYKKDAKYLFEKVKELVKLYKKNKDLGSKYNEEVQVKLESINKEDESVTNKEEEQKEFKVGDYTLKYGKYRICFNGTSCSDFTLNQDGTAMFDGKSKYFRIDKHNFAQGVDEYQSGKQIYPAIIISDSKDGNGINTYTPYATGSECLMTDGDLGCVNYIGS